MDGTSKPLEISNWGREAQATRFASLNPPPFAILHQDGDLLVLNKPAGAPLLADRAGGAALWDAIRDWREQAGLTPPLLVHRLDKGTSGVMLVALSDRAQRSLTRQFAHGIIEKTYLAVTRGIPNPSRAQIDLPLCPGRKGRFRVAGPRAEIALDCSAFPPVWRLGQRPERPAQDFWWLGRPVQESSPNQKACTPNAHPSFTSYRVVRTLHSGNAAEATALVMLRPRTGRRHQLRVHLAWIGWPIAGDPLYPPRKNAEGGGENSNEPDTLRLHCRKISFVRDWDSDQPPRQMAFRAPMPPGFLPGGV